MTVLTETEVTECLEAAGVPSLVTDALARDLIRGLGLPVPDGPPNRTVWMRGNLAQDIARRMRAEAHAEQVRDLRAALTASGALSVA
jgi:hypothetical protein